MSTNLSSEFLAEIMAKLVSKHKTLQIEYQEFILKKDICNLWEKQRIP